jgi:hypothetical protein
VKVAYRSPRGLREGAVRSTSGAPSHRQGFGRDAGGDSQARRTESAGIEPAARPIHAGRAPGKFEQIESGARERLICRVSGGNLSAATKDWNDCCTFRPALVLMRARKAAAGRDRGRSGAPTTVIACRGLGHWQ